MKDFGDREENIFDKHPLLNRKFRVTRCLNILPEW